MTTSSHNQEFPQIPGFTIIRTIGRGGMAQVYLGIQDSMDREVAIKVMLPQLQIDPSFGERFLQEAHIAAKLAHSHIVAVIDVGVVDDLYYMAMAYHSGGDLTSRIREGLSEKESISIVRDIALALDYAHANGFMHRDIKPDNILFSSSGSPVLSDFGIARAVDSGSQLTATGMVVGTPHYMSPEHGLGTPIDGRADLYSLGVVFYQMLMGALPFDGESAMSIAIKHMRDPIPSLPAHLSRYQTFFDKILAKDPQDRWQTGADIARTLEILELQGNPVDGDIMSTAISAQVPPTQIHSNTIDARPVRKTRTGMVAGVLVTALLASVIVWQQGWISVKTKTTEQVTPTVSSVKTMTNDMASEKSNQETVIEKKTDLANIDPVTTEQDPGIDKEVVAEKMPKPIVKSELSKVNEPEPVQVVQERIKPQVTPVQVIDKKPLPEKVAKAELKPVPVSEPDPELLRLTGYVRDANDYLSPARLSEPRLEEALRLYKSAFAIAPDDYRVKALLEKIASSYVVLADEARLQKSWDEARRLVDMGLSAMPGHRGLENMLVTVNSDKEAASEPSFRRRSFGGF